MGFLDIFKNKKTVEKGYNTDDRYTLEHILLPQLISGENGATTISLINQQEGRYFTEIYKVMHKDEEQYVCRYSPLDFKVQRIRLAGEKPERFVLQIQMPAPERVPLCGYVFILHDEHFENRRYITAELSHSGQLLLCEWRQGEHWNYGPYSKSTINGVLMGSAD